MTTRRSFVLSAVPVAGCAITRTDAEYAYAPSFRGATTSQSLRGLALGEMLVYDQRQYVIGGGPISDPKMLIRKRNGYGQLTEGVYAADKQLREYVEQALLHGLSLRGATLSKTAPAILEVRIRDLTDSIDSRGLLSTKLSLHIATEVSLRSGIGGRVYWSQRAFGSEDLKIAGMNYAVDDLLRSLAPTLDDLVVQILDSPQFLQALRAANGVA